MLTALPPCAGLLFVGDVHILSTRPGRRVDDYAAAILAKLEQAAQISCERKLQPVFLGDLFHRSSENSLTLLTAVIAVFRKFYLKPVVLSGSHDRQGTWLREQDALYLLQDCGVLQVADKPGPLFQGPCGTRETPIQLWATPAGHPIPDEIPALEGDGVSFMVTHHDLAFKGMYPGASALKEIKGCDMMINGHMHTPTPMVVQGSTCCFNPGSISRPSVDLKNHVPAVFAWTPGSGFNLERIPLKFVPGDEVFDLTGKHVGVAPDAELKATLPRALRLSKFAAVLGGGTSLEASRTEDGSVLADELASYFDEKKSSPSLRGYLAELLESVVTEKGAA